MKLTDDLLHKAAGLAQQQEMEEYFSPSDQPLPISDTLLAWMLQLAEQLEQGKLIGAKALLGWHYYVRNTAAAVLIGFLCLAAVAPEVVQAAYQKLIESVETVFDTHTEFRFTSHASADSEFVPLTITWLPEDLVEVERTERPGRVCYEYETQETGDRYFVLFQDYMKPGSSFEYGIDTEDAEQEIIYIRQSEVRLVHKDGKTNFIWYNDSLFITGQSNLDTDQIVQILNGLKYR